MLGKIKTDEWAVVLRWVCKQLTANCLCHFEAGWIIEKSGIGSDSGVNPILMLFLGLLQTEEQFAHTLLEF